ncbi:MAG TPA: hypothetical protein VH640_30465 [Bryobacteraceae bacterium]
MPALKVEQRLDALSRLRDAPAEEAVAELRKALADRVNVVVAKAAKIAADRQFQALTPDLLQAYERLFEDAVKRDPQCWGKTALARALKDLGYSESAPFLRGLEQKQMEPVWGGEVDTAENLRGACLLALPQCPDLERGEALRRFVDGLTEKSPAIRQEAARGLGQMAGDEGALLLRLKARVGDESPQVIGQVFDSLLAIEGESALRFVANFLPVGNEAAEEAALALGSTRLEGAFEILRKAWTAARDPQFRAVLLRAASISRLEAAIGWLVEMVRSGRKTEAESAIEALALHASSEEIRRRVESAVAGREGELQEAFRKYFGGS